MLQGRIAQSGDNLSISVELVDVEDNSHLWGEQYNRKLADALAVQDEIAAQISDKLRLKLSSQQKTRPSVKAKTQRRISFISGAGFYVSEDRINKALDCFRQAIAIDPNLCTGLRRDLLRL